MTYLALTNIGNMYTSAESVEEARANFEAEDDGIQLLKDKDGKGIVVEYPYSLIYPKSGGYSK